MGPAAALVLQRAAGNRAVGALARAFTENGPHEEGTAPPATALFLGEGGDGPAAVLATGARIGGHAVPSGTSHGGEAADLSGPQRTPLENELDAAIGELMKKRALRDAAIAERRKARRAFAAAQQDWVGYRVHVDEALRAAPDADKPHELDLRLLQTAFAERGDHLGRADAEELCARLLWTSSSAASETTVEQINSNETIYYRTQAMPLAFETYDELEEDRRQRWADAHELLHTGPDIGAEMLLDAGKSVYNGVVDVAQGLVDLPAAPYNFYQALTGGESHHFISLDGLRAEYRTSWGLHFGAAGELGAQLALLLFGGEALSLGGEASAAGETAEAAEAVQGSGAPRFLANWMKVNGASAGATAVVQAVHGIRDLTRGYVTGPDGTKRPLTGDDVLDRIAGIAFGLHAARSSLRGSAKPRRVDADTESPPPPFPPLSRGDHPSSGYDLDPTDPAPRAGGRGEPGRTAAPAQAPSEEAPLNARAGGTREYTMDDLALPPTAEVEVAPSARAGGTRELTAEDLAARARPRAPSTERGGTEARAGDLFHWYTAAEITLRLRIDYDPIGGRPRRVSYVVSGSAAESAATTKRSFARDATIEGPQPTGRSNRKTGWDRGHLAQREAGHGDPEIERALDRTTNVVPMAPELNRGAGSPWRAAEQATIDAAAEHGYVTVDIEVFYGDAPQSLPDGTPIPVGFRRTVTTPDGRVLRQDSFVNQ